MQIIVDKIEEYPRHAISRSDVHLILSTLPLAWTDNLKVVRLSASRSASRIALYVRSDETLTIASRGHAMETTLRACLWELAAHALGFKQWPFQHLQARYKSRVETLVSPLMDELLPLLAHKKTTRFV